MIKFNAETHQYFNEDGKELKSVTTLLKQHGLAPAYSGVNPDVLKRAAARGTMIHNEIRDWYQKQSQGITKEFYDWIKWAKVNNITDVQNELIVHNDYIAGMLDIFFCMSLTQWSLADFKTGASIDRTYCAWQLSIYEYLLGRTFNNLLILHLTSNGIKTIDLTNERIPKEEIERLIECDKNMEIYTPAKKEIAISDKDLAQIYEAEKIIIGIEEQLDTAKNNAAKLREGLMALMQANNVKTFESNLLKVSYVAPSSRISIDTKQLKEKYPDIASECSKTSDIKASLRISIKKEAA
ncbi:MAG: hypothetical protein LBT79_01690 [Elusimicrobiota bacterium]|jgi:hypothetical protein|nr:hypothetical protein [Elusimicrobiota bacterium]